jgi:hypothetical protein
MAKARWWVCAACKSLNDLPANKCYKCRAGKPADPMLLDEHYGSVAPQQRVSISVDLHRIGELSRPDPKETQPPSVSKAIFGTTVAQGSQVVYGALDDEPLESARRADEPKTPPRPLREPVKRGLAEAGGYHWTMGLTGLPDPPPLGQAPTGQPVVAPGQAPTGQPMAPGQAPTGQPMAPGQAPTGQPMAPGQASPGRPPQEPGAAPAERSVQLERPPTGD